MTADERVAKVTAKLFRDYPSVGLMLDTHAVYFERDVADAIRAAVLEEREACAKAAEAAAKKNEYCPPGCKCGNGYHIALAIRGRE